MKSGGGLWPPPLFFFASYLSQRVLLYFDECAHESPKVGADTCTGIEHNPKRKQCDHLPLRDGIKDILRQVGHWQRLNRLYYPRYVHHARKDNERRSEQDAMYHDAVCCEPECKRVIDAPHDILLDLIILHTTLRALSITMNISQKLRRAVLEQQARFGIV